MTMDAEIISIEKIKPSFPTPNHLKQYKLCSLDLLIPAPYAPIVIFYPNHEASTHAQVLERVELLKKSLSKILTRFFPLAGTIKDEFSIDCDDQGACFTTTKVNYSLSYFLENPNLNLISQFLPNNIIHSCITHIQANIFQCGGIALGVCISHKILDGTSLSFFLKSWSQAASSSTKVLISPDFSAASLFPVNDLKLKDASKVMWDSLFKKGKFVTKRFVFDSSAIATLKNEENGITTNPTRVEAVSAFIWKYAMDACEKNYGTKKPSHLTHIVNLRKRAVPTFSEESLGNLYWMASAKIKRNYQHGFNELVDEVRKSISKIDCDYVKKLRGDEGSDMMYKYLKEIEEFGGKKVDHFGFTSWCKLGFYDIDFGWGRPIWVSSIGISGSFFINLVILMETRCGNGIEAWMTLDEQEMDVLETNQEFREFASLNPSPLHNGNAK